MKDISTYEDCLLMVEKFYDKLLIDPEVSHYFVHLDLKIHIPRVADFWAFILVDKAGYSGNMMAAHAKLPLKESDFRQWLNLFQETVEENFQGEKAKFALERSKLIAWTMTSKMEK